jgi:hypothetical protein
MTVLTDTQVVTASGGLVELGYSQITSIVTVSSTSEGASGTSVIPSLTVVCDGSPVLVEFYASRVDAPANASGNTVITNLLYDGANQGRLTVTGSGNNAQILAPAFASFRMTPAAGVHTFAVTAFRNNANGYIWNDSNGRAFLRVSKIVQATQWPAVTTGTIICTSSTRPASPFAGQQIYETDTSRYWTYSTWAQWVPDDMVFATETARDTAIPSANATEGMRAYITGSTVAAATGEFTAVPTGIQTIYNGSSWVCITPVGTRTSNTGQTTSNTYTATLTGTPGTNGSLTLSTGTTALVAIASHISASASAQSCVSVAVSGATTLAASDTWDIESTSTSAYTTAARTFVLTGLTAGTNTFTLQYRSNVGTCQVAHRCLTVQGIA